jgi:hypothetical protein
VVPGPSRDGFPRTTSPSSAWPRQPSWATGQFCGSTEEVNAYLAWLAERTANLLARPQHRRAVELIAAELLARQVLSGRRARQLFRQACARRS